MKCLAPFILLFLTATTCVAADSSEGVLFDVRKKMMGIKSYSADMSIKVDIPFLKAPASKAKIWFQAPNKTHIEAPGFALFPKQGADQSFVSLLNDPFVSFNIGTEEFQGIVMRKIKIIPTDDESQVAVATVLIDTTTMLPRKVTSTTKKGGTIIAELVYNDAKAAAYCLPSYIKLVMDIGEFDIPTTMTGDFESKKKTDAKSKKQSKAMVEISYYNYDLNISIPASKFKD